MTCVVHKGDTKRKWNSAVFYAFYCRKETQTVAL